MVAVLGGAIADAAEIKLLCSDALKAVVEDLTPTFEQTTGHKVAATFGLSAALKRRIESGEPFDVVIITAPLVDDLIAQGKIARDTRTAIARSGMALAIRSGAAKPDIRTTDALKRSLLASPSIAYAREGASGVFFTGLIDRLGLRDGLKSNLRPMTTGVEVSAAVAHGDAALGVLPVSEILPVSGIELLGPFPPDVQGYVVMTAGASAGAQMATNEWIRFLASAAADSSIKKRGMER
jgi:molybdate transport system substrate-binding protein